MNPPVSDPPRCRSAAGLSHAPVMLPAADRSQNWKVLFAWEGKRDMSTFIDDPLASGSGQFALSAPLSWAVPTDPPSEDGLRPWGLRRMGPVLRPSGRREGWHYDPVRQLGVDADGVPLATLQTRASTTTGSAGTEDPGDEDWTPDFTPDAPPMAGPPTAPTTPPVDGEDPPSAEDWINDYCPDDPFVP
jgi:putative ATP-grasp target RiPP